MITYSSTGGSSIAIPPELLRSTPREAKLTAAGVLAWVLVVLLGVGGIVGGTLTFFAADRWTSLKNEMRSSGVTVEGTVTQLRKTSGKNPERLVSYRYTVEGHDYQNRMRMSLRRSAQFSIGSTVQVRYLPRDPQIGWLQGFEPSGAPIFLVPLILLVSGLLVFLLLWNLRRQRTLLTEGRPTLATVLSVDKVRKGDKRGLRVKYDFEILSGATRSGSKVIHRNPPAVGSTIIVLYDRENPSAQIQYPLSLYRLE
jgi:hypothetical protein